MSWGRRALKGTALTLLGLFVAYSLLAGLGLPLAVREAIKEWEAQTPGLAVSLQSISFNPFTWTLRVRGLVVRQQGQTLASMDGLDMALGLSSVVRRAVVLDEVVVSNPTLSLHWDAHGHLDLEQILPHSRRHRLAKKESPSLPWQIDHLALTNVQLSVIDPAVGLTDALQLTLPSLDLDHIGTLHGGDDRFALDLHGRYDNKPIWDLHWQGDIDFAPLSSAGHIELDRLSLPWLDDSLGHRWPLRVHDGSASLGTDYQMDDLKGERLLVLRRSTFDIEKLELATTLKDGPRLALRQLRVEADQIDTLRHTLTGTRLLLDRPEVLVHREADGRLDLQRLLQSAPAKTPAKPAAPAPAWALHWPLMEVRSARLAFEDRMPKGYGSWRLDDLGVRVENLQNTDDSLWRLRLEGRNPAPGKLAAEGRWRMDGALHPQSGGVQADWQLESLSLPPLNDLLARVAPLTVRDGELAAKGSLEGNIHQPKDISAQASVQFQHIDLLAPQGELRAQLLAVGPLHYHAGRVQLDGLHGQSLHATQGDRVLDLAGLDSSGGSLNLQGPELGLARLQLAGLSVDGGKALLPHVSGKQAQLTVNGFSWDGAGQRLAVGEVDLAGGGLSLQNAGKTINIGWQQLGLQNLGGDLAQQRWTLGGLSGSGWSWQGRRPWVQLTQLSLGSSQLDLAQHQVNLGAFQISGGQVVVLRRHDGGIQPWPELQAMLAAAPKPPAAASSAVAVPAGPAWQATLQGIDIGLDSVQLIDMQQQIPQLPITQLAIKTGPWSTSSGQALQTHVQLGLDQGQWQWDGSITPQPLRVDGQLSVQGLALQPLQALLASTSYAGIDHGSLSTSGHLSLHQQAGALQAHYDGSLQSGDTLMVDQRNQQPMLSWHSIALPQLTLDWPGALLIPAINLDGFYTRISIQADHHLNWETLLKPAPATMAKAPPAAATPAPAAPAFAVRVGEVNLIHSGEDFADNSLLSPFQATIHELTGSIGPFASDSPQQWTTIALKGQVNSDGYMQVAGKVMPLSKPLRADVDVHFKDIQMPTLNPYAAEFAGYRIDQGMLDLQLHYTLDQGRIDGSNKARIDQLELGPQVRTKGGPDLPLRAAVDILRNDEGVIQLDVPVQGDLNDPSLTMRDIVFTALEGVLRSTLESPFNLVAGLLGSDADTLRHVGFAAGGKALSAHEQSKLQSIAQVLAQHEKLLVFIRPSYNPSVDAASPPPASGAPATADALRALALQRAEAIKTALKKAGIHDHRIFIDEPVVVNTLGKTGNVLTTLDLKAP